MTSLQLEPEIEVPELLLALQSGSIQQARELWAQVEARARTELTSDSHLEAKSWFDARARRLIAFDEDRVPGSQAEVLLLFSMWYMKEGEWPICLSVTEKAVDLARRAEFRSLLRRSLSILGAVCSKAKDLERATVCFAESIQIAEELGDRLGLCAVLANLAECRFNAGILEESITLNEHIIELSKGDSDLVAATAHHNIALIALTLSDVPMAAKHIRLAAANWLSPTTAFSRYQRIISELTFIRVLIAQNQLEEAKAHADIVKRYAEQIGGRPAANQARLAQALCDMASGKADEALWAIERLKHEVHENEPLLRDVMEAEILCYRQTARDGQARYCQQRHLFHLAEWQRKYALKQIADVQRMVHDPHAALPNSRAGMAATSSLAAGSRGPNYVDRLESLATISELREDPSGQHAIRVGRLTAMLARESGYEEKFTKVIDRAARMHDLGKLAVPDAVVCKRGKLSRFERDVLRRHAMEGCQMITDVLASLDRVRGAGSTPQAEILRIAAQVTLHHHEWWDGSGYPRGVAGASIPESARMVAICDWFDELTKGRVHRKARSVDQSVEQIMRLAGVQFDPVMCEQFAKLIQRLKGEFGNDLHGFANSGSPISAFAAANQVIARIMESTSRTNPALLRATTIA